MDKTLDTITKVTRCKISKKIIVATLELQEIKETVLRRKSRLKEGKILIENDLL